MKDGGGNWRILLINTMAQSHAISKEKILCDTNTVMLVSIAIMIDTKFPPFSKRKILWVYHSKKVSCGEMVA